MRVIRPISRRFRNQLEGYGVIPIPRNWLFRRVLYLLRRARCLLTCVGEVSQRTQTVPPTNTVIRVIDVLAKKTLVFNEGGQAATIYEGGIIVGIVAPGESLQIPVAGYFQLQAKTDSGTTNLRVLTYRRCLCGDTIPPYDTGIIPPTGGNLI